MKRVILKLCAFIRLPKELLNSRKGSYIIFLTLFLVAVMILVNAVIWASGQRAVSSGMYYFGNLWGRSILAEYDRMLFQRYGLFAFYGNEFETAQKLDYYINHTVEDKSYIHFSGTEVELKDYRLADKDCFHSQLEQAVLCGGKPEPVHKSDTEDIAEAQNRRITAGWILNGLPSKGVNTGISGAAVLEAIKSGPSLSGLISNAATCRYMFTYFRNACSDGSLGETYFRNEIEYILSGKADDEKAKNNVYTKLLVLRNGLNLEYLYTCPEKRDAVMAVAEVITPGPAAVLTQAAILESWAFLEALNDMKLLYDNKPVELLKRDCNYALTLENVLEKEFGVDLSGNEIDIKESDKSVDYIEPEKLEGACYEDYLRVLAAFMPENTRLLRIMDLIQINMKYLYCDWFLISDYYTGLDYGFNVNGVRHDFTQKY